MGFRFWGLGVLCGRLEGNEGMEKESENTCV